jgi:hypothetical protein
MFEPLIYLIYAACGLTVFFGLLPLVVSIAYRGNPPPQIASMLDRYVEVSLFGATSIFSPLRFIKRKEPDKIEPSDKKQDGQKRASAVPKPDDRYFRDCSQTRHAGEMSNSTRIDP